MHYHIYCQFFYSIFLPNQTNTTYPYSNKERPFKKKAGHVKEEKKPYNPVLGEQFFCNMGDATCVCEQVCHHPPISAFYLEDEKAGVSLNGHSKLLFHQIVLHSLTDISC